MTVELRTLRVSAEMDAAKYQAGAQQKIAADKAMAASSQGVGAAVSQTDTKISHAGDVLARLSRQYVDGYAAAQRMQSAVNSLSRGIDAGKITMAQAEPILEGIFRKYGQIGDGAQFAAKGQHEFAAAISNTTARLTAQAAAATAAAASVTRVNAAANQNMGHRGAANFNASNAAFQVQDIAMMAAMGQSPLATAMQQGPQLAMIMQMGGGLPALASGLMSLVSPTMLITVGMTAATAAAIQYFTSAGDGAMTLTDRLKEHVRVNKELIDGWEKAENVVRGLEARSSQTILAFQSQETVERLRSQFGAGTDSAGFLKAFTDSSLFSGRPDISGTGRAVSQRLIDLGLEEPVTKFLDGVVKGYPDLVKFNDELAAMGQTPGASSEMRKKINEIIEFTKDLTEAQRAIQEFDRNLGPGGLIRGGSDFNRRDMEAFEEWRREENRARSESRRTFDAELQTLGARSPAERRAAAEERERARIIEGESGNIRRDRIEHAGKLELARAEKELADARLERSRSLDATMAQQQLEISLIGQTAGEVARLRMEYELTAQLRDEAARNGVAADEKELALIREKAAEYGRYAEQIARTNLNRDLAFERDQLSRSSGDQAIAGRLRGAGLAIDLNSPEAQQMRELQRVTALRSEIKGFFTDFRSGLMDGKNIGEAFGDAILNALTKQLDKWSDLAIDGLVNAIVGSFGGKGTGGGIATGVGGGLLGMLGGAAANDNFAAPVGAVSRGVGGAVDLASNLLGLSEKSPGQINSFLKAGGVDINAAQTAWCAAFVNSSLEQIGVDGTGSLTANSFLNWGSKIDPSKVLRGDVLVKPNGFGVGQTGGHVGLATGATRMGAGGLQLEMLSGNTGGPGLGTGGVGLDWVDAAKLDVRRAAQDISKMGKTAAAATEGLGGFAGGLSQLGNALMSVGGGAGGSGWFSGLMGMFGGVSGAVGHMMSISPLATSFLAGGGVGLFARGGITDRPAIFGEAGPEAAVPLPDGRRIPVEMRGGGAGGLHITWGWDRGSNGNITPVIRDVVEKETPGIARQEAAGAVNRYSYRQRQGGAAADDHRYKRLKRMG